MFLHELMQVVASVTRVVRQILIQGLHHGDILLVKGADQAGDLGRPPGSTMGAIQGHGRGVCRNKVGPTEKKQGARSPPEVTSRLLVIGPAGY